MISFREFLEKSDPQLFDVLDNALGFTEFESMCLTANNYGVVCNKEVTEPFKFIYVLVHRSTITQGHGETAKTVELACGIGKQREQYYYPSFASRELAEQFMAEMKVTADIAQIPFYESKPTGV